MAKSHKTKKHLKSEKSKTKLKTKDSKTKFLPKGANVTDVNFKIKQIVVPEQLKSHGEDEVVSRRKLNIKDLLSRLKHYNTNIKSDAIQDLMEVFSLYEDEPVSVVIQSYISQILQNACHLVLDKEKLVRQKAIKLISLIMSTVDQEKIFPFSNILSSHLKCAMTDIDKNVQADSLLLLDSLVTYFPDLIIKNANQILPIFFILISSVQTSSNRGKILTLNLQSNSTSTRWRLQVLNRLQRILTVVVNKTNKNNGADCVNANGKVYFANQNYNLPIYNDIWMNYFHSFVSKNCYDNEDELGDNSTGNYVNTLIPLLYDTWLEVLPENSAQNKNNVEGTILSQEAASIFKSILTIFYLVWQLANDEGKKSAQEMWVLFSSKVGKKFLNRILNQYPFAQSNLGNAKKKDFKDILELNEDLKCVDVNLLVCYLFCVTNKKIYSDQQKYEAEKVIDYLMRCLVNRNYVKEESVPYLITVIRILLLNNSQNWIQKELNVLGVLEGLVHFYGHTTSLTEETRKGIMELLCKIPQNPLLNSSKNFEEWLSNLPYHLSTKDVSHSVINTVLLLSKQKNVLIQNGLVKYVNDILDNLSNVDIEEEDQRVRVLNILSCFFYIPSKNKNKSQIFVHYSEKLKTKPLGKMIKDLLVFYRNM